MALLSGKKIKNNPNASISFRTKIKDAEYTIGQNNGAKYFQLKTSNVKVGDHNTQNLQLDHDAAVVVRDILDKALKNGLI